MIKMNISTDYAYVMFYLASEHTREVEVKVYNFSEVTDLSNDDRSDGEQYYMVDSLGIQPKFQITYKDGGIFIDDMRHVHGTTMLENREDMHSYVNMIKECHDMCFELVG